MKKSLSAPAKIVGELLTVDVSRRSVFWGAHSNLHLLSYFN